MLERIDFLATDGALLNGILYKENSKKVIIAVHGMTSNCMKERDNVIALEAEKKDISYFCFNNRGSELIRYVNIKDQKQLAGTTYEDVLDAYFDIKGAILKMKELGFEEIYLQGHSLGCTKIVYTYNKLKQERDFKILENIKGIILLSLVDIPRMLKLFSGEKFAEYLKLAEEKEAAGKYYEIMPKEAFIHLVSVKTYLRYCKYNEAIDFAKYHEKDFEILNSISVPLFMRWGNVNEMIEQDANELANMLNDEIENEYKDIDYINGADHGYHDKEELLASQIIEFINKID